MRDYKLSGCYKVFIDLLIFYNYEYNLNFSMSQELAGFFSKYKIKKIYYQDLKKIK